MSAHATSDPSLRPDDVATVVDQAIQLAPLIDGHNDWAWECRLNRDYSVEGLERGLSTDTDIARLRAGRVGGQFWSVYVSDDHLGADAVQGTLEQIDWVYRLAARYPSDFGIARSAADVEAARAAGRIASLLGAEGAHCLNDSPAVLRMFARLGVRYLTLTHVHNTEWADSGTDDPVHGGLSARGVEYIRELNRLGMLVDLSHVSPATAHAALDASDSPVIFSHSSCRALSDHPRNVPDDVLRRLAVNGGVLMLTFVPQFLSADYSTWFEGGQAGPGPTVTLTDVADHVEHARDVAGIRHIGLGGDYDGTDEFPVGLEGVDGYPALLAELARRGWPAADLAALAGANVLRVLRETDAAFAAAGDAASGGSVPRLVR
ncbi:membrane dipeptidase [Cryobacterium sp. TMT1-21]|uniref:Membrane dipeptidase n=1 Tax=Cryobacterium shii TaxID=1259235 RepID=A0AAQ2HH58_9MICO|nr:MULTISPECIES: dipeptidase [Cryobacterium]TFC52369.1 membrane dipeptidase [Cryobacterium shii]TFC87515.1 membrane dipeptidase [Cryobacterium sp. TmT2-59]TFD10863.1 membrane dipeptidase [Cryobacterium sp. TMT1-21]TFD16530.1 membrane dipeptidase [Cryobacterium sp. TMT2-23]TFD20498.1 membrane dipeptidase [Cryobacterium sp. TMT4-10]